MSRFWDKFCTKDLFIRYDDKVVHIKLKKWVQISFAFLLSVVFLAVIGLGVFQYMYGSMMYGLNDKLNRTDDHLKDVIADFEVYRSAVNQIDIEGVKYAEPKEVAVLKAKINALTAVAKRKLDEYASGSFPDDKITLKSALVKSEMSEAETQELKKRVLLLEEALKEAQEAQIVVLDKVTELADEEISDIDQRLEKVKEAIKRAGYNFDKIYADTEKKIEDTRNESQGGPFIPAAGGKIDEFPELKNQKVDESLNRLNQSLNKWNVYNHVYTNLPLGKPLRNYRISAAFGNRFDPFNGEISVHEGLDMATEEGDEVKAVGEGKITYAARMGMYGLLVEIDHGNFIRTRYAHLGKIMVKKGDIIKIGDTIGLVGNTGRSTGPHLHYEVRVRDIPVNPYNFIKVKKDVFKI